MGRINRLPLPIETAICTGTALGMVLVVEGGADAIDNAMASSEIPASLNRRQIKAMARFTQGVRKLAKTAALAFK